MSDEKKITPRSTDFSAWYNDIIMKAELADYSPVRGCMVIRPAGFGIWELMQSALDTMFKETGHKNAYFPLLIPQSFLAREAQHVKGFAPQTAVVTRGGGKELEEPLVIRPTSETIIYAMFAKWIQSYRDLPLLINQWANVVRWEMRTRLFLRTMEFLWQEGHTAHATEQDAEEEALTILGVYRRFMEDWMAMPVITGRKTESEKFAGALRTYGLEALMQDNKALQAGTSHNLGQNFARAFEVQYQTAEGGLEHVWNTSWGVSTRLIGGLVMTHSDDIGLICPPRLAPIQVMIVPIWRKDDDRGAVMRVGDTLLESLKDAGIRSEIDRRDSLKPGAKYYEWESKGIPVRVEIGPRDVARGEVVVAKRTGGKTSVPVDAAVETIRETMTGIQAELYRAALDRREANTHRNVARDDFVRIIENSGGFVFGGYCEKCEDTIKAETKATVRVLPDEEFRSDPAPAECAWCGGKTEVEAVWARAY